MSFSPQSAREARAEMSISDVTQYGGGALVGELTCMMIAAGPVLDSLNDTSLYTPLHEKIAELHSENIAIKQVTDRNLLQAYNGRLSAEAFLRHERTANTAKIKALRAQEPSQLSGGAEIGIIGGGMFTGVVAGLTIVYGLRKAFPRLRSSVRKARAAELDAATEA